MRQWLWVGLILLVAAGGFAGTWWGWPELYGRGERQSVPDAQTARVTRDTLVVTVSDDGEVKAAKQRVIRNELRWSAYIDWVVPDGTIVRGPRDDKPGDTIISFKCDELKEAIEEQELRLIEARNALEHAKANLELEDKETEYLWRKAQQEVKEAAEDEKRYSDPGGEGDTKLKDAETDMQMAQEEMKLAQAKLDSMVAANKELAPNSPYSKNEIEAKELNLERRKLSLSKAQDHKRMLITYDLARDKRRLSVATKEAGLAEERAKFNRDRRIAKGTEQRDAKERVLRSTQQKYDELIEDRDERLVVTAKEDGLVVYQVTRSRYRPSEVEVEVGEKIPPRQHLMIIPDMTTLQIETKVYESMISLLESKLKRNDRERRAGKPAAGERAEFMAKAQAIQKLPPDERAAAMQKLRGEAMSRLSEEGGPRSRPGGLRSTAPATKPEEGEPIRAFVKFPALGNVTVRGHVSEVAPMAEEKSHWSPGVKVYKVIVKLDEPLEGLKPNMTARVTLVLAELPDVLKVNVAAVFAEKDNTYCWLLRDGRTEKVEVKIGKYNEKEAEIVSGLREGDEVLLVAPTAPEKKQQAKEPGNSQKPGA